MAKLLRFKDLLEMDGQSPLEQKPLSFNDMHQTEYRPGEDELTNYRAYRRRKFGVGTGEGGPIGESVETDEALDIRQRLAKSRQFRRYKSKIKLGRDRAKRRMAKPDVLKRRSQKAARTLILKKITKGIDKGDLSFARRQEIEKRLEKPVVQRRIKMLARRMYKDVRKKEVARKKG
jgi:hypothetical protein